MKKEVTITLTRLFKKEVTLTIDERLVGGMSDEQIADYLIEQHPIDESEVEDLIQNVELEGVSFDEDSVDGVDTDRFDIYDDGKHVYGGHL